MALFKPLSSEETLKWLDIEAEDENEFKPAPQKV